MANRFQKKQKVQEDDLSLDEFAEKLVDLCFDYLKKNGDRDEKIVEYLDPKDLKGKLDLEIQKDPQPLMKLFQECETIVHYSVRTVFVQNIIHADKTTGPRSLFQSAFCPDGHGGPSWGMDDNGPQCEHVYF